MPSIDNKVPIDTQTPQPLNSWDEFHSAERQWKNKQRQADIEGWGPDITKYSDEDKQLFMRIQMWIDAHTPR